MAERKWQTMIYTESKVWETRTLQKKRGLTMTKNTKKKKIINKIIAYSMLKYVFISTLYISGIPVPFVQIYIRLFTGGFLT
jgi:hypothetical protein